MIHNHNAKKWRRRGISPLFRLLHHHYGKFLWSVLVVLFFTSCATMERKKLVPGSDLYRDRITSVGVDFAEGRLWDRAEKVWAQEIANNPEHAPLYYNMGVAAQKANNRNKAIEFYKKALELDPIPFYMEALAKLENTFGIGSAFYPYLLDRTGAVRTGCQLARKGLWEEADKVWDQILAGEKNNAMVLFNKSLTVIVLGNKSRGLELLEKSIALRSTSEKLQMLNWLKGEEQAPFSIPLGDNSVRHRPIHKTMGTKSSEASQNRNTGGGTRPSTNQKVPHLKVIAPNAALRSEPSVEAAVLERLKLGERVRQLSKQADWYEVATTRGTRGWIYYRYLSEDY